MSQLHVSNVIARNNIGASSGGIFVKPGANVSATGTVEDTQLSNNQFGLRVEDNSEVTGKKVTAANNTGAGFIAVSNPGVASLNLDSCVAAGNGFGIKADNANATVRIANCSVHGNGTGMSGTGHIVSFGNNFNSDSGAPNGPNILPQ